jgi:hypothetical protein
MTESTNKTYEVHYSTAQLDDNTYFVQLIINENKSKQMILNQEETTSFLKFASKYGFIADRIAF